MGTDNLNLYEFRFHALLRALGDDFEELTMGELKFLVFAFKHPTHPLQVLEVTDAGELEGI